MSSVLIKNVVIADSTSNYYNKNVNIFYENGKITSIGNHEPEASKTIDGKGAFISAGFIDSFCFCPSPGEEWKETWESISDAAAAGGFEAIAGIFGTKPYPDNGNAIVNIKNYKNNNCNFIPLASLTINNDGKNLSDLFDLVGHGAKGFANYTKAITDGGFIARAVEYCKNFNVPIYFDAFDKQLAENGSVHEGAISTQLGLKGIPSISESTVVYKLLGIAEWLKLPLHISGISSAESVELLENARKKNIVFTCSVPAMNLAFTEENLISFDENYKVLPPLRTSKDRNALVEALKNGIIDFVESRHQPEDIESKQVEFDYAHFGAATIQYCFQMLLQNETLDASKIAEIFSTRTRKFFNYEHINIQENFEGSLCIFNLDTYEHKKNYSKAINFGFNSQLKKGNILYTINKNKINEYL